MSGVCSLGPASSLVKSASQDSLVCPRVHYLLCGTFNTIFLYLLAFSPYSTQAGPYSTQAGSGGSGAQRGGEVSLKVHRRIRGEGPHQFIALDQERRTAYATTWAQPATLSSWQVLEQGRGGLKHVNTVPISATGSYLTVSPPTLPFPPRIYQAGGPVAQTFAIDERTGGYGEQIQEVIYLPGGKRELNDPKTDKTRVALRYGSHAVDIDPVRRRAYIPHVGHDTIYVYAFERDGKLRLLAGIPSHGNFGHEGPRHSIPSPSGNKLYVVTEHTSYLDVYNVHTSKPYLYHSQRLSIIPPHQHATRELYRGDTLRLSADQRRLYVTTRGKTASQRGWVATFALESDGSVREKQGSQKGYGAQSRYETQTSGGKANAIEVFPAEFWPTSASEAVGTDTTTTETMIDGAGPGPQGRDYLVLTDDELGYVSILEWRDEWNQLREVASVQLGVDKPVAGEGRGEIVEGEAATGASHAVWLS
ncbi:hypothetical protein JCM10908_004146 [Rhodotorula pacifica]|uniref:lactonase family protein n=1 Tax=Rhodotorula pacifica TaxID=1495444 RepID=UPI003176220A